MQGLEHAKPHAQTKMKRPSAAWQLQPSWCPSGANTPGKSLLLLSQGIGRAELRRERRKGTQSLGCPRGARRGKSCIPEWGKSRSTCACPHHSPRRAVQGGQLRALHVFSKPLPQPAPIPIPVAAPRPTGTSGLSHAPARAEPFTSPSGFLYSQGCFLHRPEMCEGLGRTRVCGQDHQYQEAVCSR